MTFLDSALILAHIAAFAFALSLALTGLMVFAGLLDQPIARSSHTRAVPTGGGVGILGGFGTALLAASIFYPLFGDQGMLGAVAATAMGMAFLGLIDDVHDLKPILKFLVILVLCIAAVSVIGVPKFLPLGPAHIYIPDWFAFGGAVLWLFVVTNAVNFMDGSNGLMAGVMAIAFAFLLLVAVNVQATATAVLSVAMVGALAGFFPYNAGKNARIFSGDIGALLTGFVFATSVLMLIREKPDAGLLYIGPILLLPFLTDILLTLLQRVRNRERLLQAHKTHFYQRLISNGRSHSRVCVIYMIGTLFAGGFVLVGLRTSLISSPYYLGLIVMLYVLVFLTAGNDARTRG